MTETIETIRYISMLHDFNVAHNRPHWLQFQGECAMRTRACGQSCPQPAVGQISPFFYSRSSLPQGEKQSRDCVREDRHSRATSRAESMSSPTPKIFCFCFPEVCDSFQTSRAHLRGASRSSRYVERGIAMDADVTSDERGVCERRSRVVVASRR